MTKRQLELELARLINENKRLAESKIITKKQRTGKSKATSAQFAWTKCDETTARAGGVEYGFIEFLGWTGTPEQMAAKDRIKAARWGAQSRGKFHYVPRKGWKGPKAEADKLVKF